jgi:hypothetical protein
MMQNFINSVYCKTLVIFFKYEVVAIIASNQVPGVHFIPSIEEKIRER